MRRKIHHLFFILMFSLWGCESSIDGPKPLTQQVSPTLVCSQASTWVDLQGSGYSPIPLDALTNDPKVGMPEISLVQSALLDGTAASGSPVPILQFAEDGSPRVRWTDSGSMAILVDASLGLAEGVYDVLVRNPDGKESRLAGALGVVAPPRLDALEPTPICTAQYENEILLTGRFLQIGDLLPAVRIGDVTLAPERLEDCTALVVPMENVQACSRMIVRVAQDLLPPGLHTVSVTNPPPAACTSSEEVQLLVVLPPAVEDIQPEPVCIEQQEREFSISGSGFLVISGQVPSVAIGGVDAAVTGTEGCMALEGVSGVESCTGLTVRLAAGALEPGEHAVVVTNPYGAQCASVEDVALTVVPAPEIVSIAPNPVCTAQSDMEIVIEGTGFLRIGDALPSVFVGVLALADVRMDEASCEPVPGVADAVSCTRLAAVIPQGAVDENGSPYPVTLVNPDPAGCISAAFDLEVAPPPDVVSITPSSICTGGGIFTITGSNLQNVSAYLQDPDGGIVNAGSVIVNADGTEAQVAFSSGLRPVTYDLHVTGAGGCADSLAAAVSVNLGPVIYYFDPPAVYNGVAIRATLYGSSLSAVPSAVTVAPTGGGTETALTNVAWDPLSPNRIQATIPAGLAAGTYDVFVRGVGGCDAFLSSALEVVSETRLALLNPSMNPPFGQAGTDVAVNVLAKEDSQLLAGEVNFEATPRVYLSNASTQTAVPLRAVVFESPSQLSAVVPPLPAGVYDLVVVNPGNPATVGFAPAAYEATVVAPPIIENALPNKINKEAGQTLVIYGQNFYNPEVRLECEDGSFPPVVINTAQSDSTRITVTVDASLVYNGAVCVVRVTNTANGTWDEYFSVAVTTPAGNISPFRPDYLAHPEKVAHLNTARRSPGIAFGRATRKARFLWAVGGDQGTTASALSSVEVSSIGRFGEIGPWRPLENGLPEARTAAHARVLGSFVYYIGGADASGVPSDEIWRARILDPLAVVHVEDVNLQFAPSGNGLGAGSWTYVISAVMPASDAENPGGETLPSEAVTLYAPDVPDGVEVRITWTTLRASDGITPAAAYRIYRTQSADMGAADLRLLAEIPGTGNPTHTFVDTNPATFADPARRPLSAGALGTWHLAGHLNTARAWYGLVEVSEYSATGQATSCTPFLYVLGGATDTATESSSYEVFDISGGHLAAPVQFAASGNLPARRENALWAATAGNSTALLLQQCEFYLYSGSGASGPLSSPTVVNSVRVAKYSLGANGQLGAFGEAMQSGNIVTYRAYGAFWSGDRAYNLGGYQAGVIVSNVMDGRWTALTEPRIQNFTSSGQNLNAARAYYGYTRVGNVFYIVGGVNASGVVLDSSEYNVR